MTKREDVGRREREDDDQGAYRENLAFFSNIDGLSFKKYKLDWLRMQSKTTTKQKLYTSS